MSRDITVGLNVDIGGGVSRGGGYDTRSTTGEPVAAENVEKKVEMMNEYKCQYTGYDNWTMRRSEVGRANNV